MNNAIKIVSIGIATIVLSLVISLVVAGKFSSEITSALEGRLGSVDLNRTTKALTNSFASCGTTSTLAVATSTSRQNLAIVNDSNQTVYLALGEPAVGSNGIRLNPGGGSYEMDSNFLYTGPIYCIASSTSQLTVTEAK